jgi:transketolase
MLLYSLLHLSGYARPTIEDIAHFRQLGSPAPAIPENFLLAGVEATTGPLGQGLAMAVGMAIAERHLNAAFGDGLVDHRTWVVAGDGCLMEGVNHEAAGLAGHLGLGRLIVLWDDNRITIDGATDLSTSEDVAGRYEAYGWHVGRCDGMDAGRAPRARRGARRSAAVADRLPHDHRLRRAEQAGHRRHARRRARRGRGGGGAPELGWTSAPFEIPGGDRFGLARGRPALRGHACRMAAPPRRKLRARRVRAADGGAAARRLDLRRLSRLARRQPAEDRHPQGLGAGAGSINAASCPRRSAGSADLTGSNNTKTKAQKPLTKEDYSGRYIYYGIREFGMAAAMNGMALHGG